MGALLAGMFVVCVIGLLPGGLTFARGVMVFVTLDELTSTARKNSKENHIPLGINIGFMFVIIYDWHFCRVKVLSY